MTIVFLWEHLSIGREGNSDESSLCIGCFLVAYGSVGASLVAQLVKKPTAMQETLILFLSWEDLEKGKATHSSILGLLWWLNW